MHGRAARRTAPGGLLVVGLLVVLVLGSGWIGRPVLAYARSGSMEPTIMTGDAYVASPWPQDVGPGDIVVFESEVLGSLAVHRILEGDSSGWVTQGDANAFTDQEVGEPLVTPDRVRGRVLEWPDGSPVRIPKLGLAAIHARMAVRQVELSTGLDGLAITAAVALAGAGILMPAARLRPLDAARSRPTPRLRARKFRWWMQHRRRLQVGSACFILAVSLWTVELAQEDIPMTLVVTESPPPGSHRAALPGHALERELHAHGLAGLPAFVIVDETSRVQLAEGDRVHGVPIGGAAPIFLSHEAGDRIGLQEDQVTLWRYPALVPAPIVLALHEALPGSLYVVVGAFAAMAVVGMPEAPVALLPPRKATRKPEVKP